MEWRVGGSLIPYLVGAWCSESTFAGCLMHYSFIRLVIYPHSFCGCGVSNFDSLFCVILHILTRV